MVSSGERKKTINYSSHRASKSSTVGKIAAKRRGAMGSRDTRPLPGQRDPRSSLVNNGATTRIQTAWFRVVPCEDLSSTPLMFGEMETSERR